MVCFFWKDCYERCRALCRGLTSLYALKLWISHGNNTFSSVYLRWCWQAVGTLLKLQSSPCSLNAGDGWQPFDLKQPRAKLRLKMQQMTICSPHSCRYCKHGPYLERREWQPVVSDDKTLKYIFTSFLLKEGVISGCFLWQVFPKHLPSCFGVEFLLVYIVFQSTTQKCY